jgi:hypothetical protein
MTTTEESPISEPTDELYESAFEWEWRVLAVSMFWSLPGVLAGGLARLLLADGGSRTFCTAGRSSPIRIAMMAMTTNNSIRVKAFRFRRMEQTS